MLLDNERRDALTNLFMFGYGDNIGYEGIRFDRGGRTDKISNTPLDILPVIEKVNRVVPVYQTKKGLAKSKFYKSGLWRMSKLSRAEKRLPKSEQRLLKKKYKAEFLVLERRLEVDLAQGQRNVELR